MKRCFKNQEDIDVKIIMIKKYMSLVSLIVLISLLFAGCETKNDDKIEFKTYSNAQYTIQYPLHWLEPEVKQDPYNGNDVDFSKADDQFALNIMVRRIYPYSNSKDYLEEILEVSKEVNKEDVDVEEYMIDGNKGYEIKGVENNELTIFYLFQEKDMIFQIRFVCQVNDYNTCKATIEQIINTFEFNDFEALNALKDNWNKYSIENLEIYYPDNSDIYGSIEEWAQVRVEAFDYISKYLGVEWEYEPIKVFVFNSKEHGRQVGLELGLAISVFGEVYTEDTQSPGHEIAHCISYWMNNGERIDSDLINEGLATHLNMLESDHHRVTADILKERNYNIKLLGNDFWEHKAGYTFGASFVQYLIDEYSLEVFKDFFAQNKYNEEESFIKFYDKEGIMLVNEWMEYLKTY